ncbi:MAG: GNAT family N-acetyltransferase [Flavobacteriaceae bacterium]|nr:GNAT family N-acetyltransferase [Bacteroidia bacterium]NND10607.1 GNAT family N-acetyltransferase [Flavobacteriaceae bacterium]NNK27480.1 GNAT family N-acetyltransferase [Flavobacteriaceae bacterium]NNL61806.1 GNAT family N-acetyltransferase [Flavobacteriaceae bacterium]
MNIIYQRAYTDKELQEILKLQSRNLKETLTDKEMEKEGFVTLKHDLEILKKMNVRCAHCIAKHKDKIVGYALSMHPDFKSDIPLLSSMFIEVEKTLKEKGLSVKYIAMGQICIDKDHRGKGIFRGLYQFMAQELNPEFDAIITEVDITNVRSSVAHQAVGFKVLKTHTAYGQNWEIISLDIKVRM